MSDAPRWMIYGANGYTGRIIAAEALRRGMQPILAGRNAAAIEALAAELGLEARVLGLDDAEALATALLDVELVLHCAGPYIDTNKPMLKACIANHTHYLDITGEVAVFERVIKWRDTFVDAGIVAVPGVGFDVVPSDCLARRLHEQLPSARRLTLGIHLDATASPGTARTYAHALPAGGLVRRAGKIEVVPPVWRTRMIDFGRGPEQTFTIAWGDVSTAFHSSGFTDVECYFHARAWVLWAFRLTRPIRFLLAPRVARDTVGAIAGRLYRGPDAATRRSQGAQIWARATDERGQSATLLLRCPDGYELTADAALQAVQSVLAGEVAPGGYTPAMAFGSGFLDRLRDVEVEEVGST